MKKRCDEGQFWDEKKQSCIDYTLDNVWSRDSDEVIEGGAVRTLNIPQKNKTIFEGKDIKKIGTLGDLRKIGNEFMIANALNEIVRKIKFKNGEVEIDAMDGNPIKFDVDTPVYYEEWFMDRGSYLIYIDEMDRMGKLATEYDPIVKK